MLRKLGYGNNVEVVTGKNTIEVPESAPIIAVKAKDGYALVSVSDGTTDYVDRDGNSEVNVKVTDGMMVTVKTTELVRDKTVMFYVDDAERPSKIFLKRKDYTMIGPGYGLYFGGVLCWRPSADCCFLWRDKHVPLQKR